MTPEAEALGLVVSALRSAGARYYVGGSYASSAWGQAKATHAFDLAIQMAAAQVPLFVEALGSAFPVSEAELLQATHSIAPYRMAQVLHSESLFKFDLFFLGDNEYSDSAFEMSCCIDDPLGPIQVASAETITIEKLRWYEYANRVSDRQWNDIVNVLETQVGKLDLDYMRKWAAHFSVGDLLEAALLQARP